MENEYSEEIHDKRWHLSANAIKSSRIFSRNENPLGVIGRKTLRTLWK